MNRDRGPMGERHRPRAHRRCDGLRPLVFDLAQDGMRGALEALALTGSVLTVHDPLLQRDAYGRWVLFPWSGRLVHVPPPAESRGNGALETGLQRRIAVVGLTLASWGALALLREGIGQFYRLADDGEVRPGDVRAMPVGIHDVGTPKTEAVARAMYEIDPFVEIECVDSDVDEGDVDPILVDVRGLDLVLVGSDRSLLHARVERRARELGIPVVQVGERVDVELLKQLLERHH